MQINAKELRQHLSEYLERASRGQSMDISMRGTPIARLTKIESQKDTKQDDLFGIWSDDQGEDASAQVRNMRKVRRFND